MDVAVRHAWRVSGVVVSGDVAHGIVSVHLARAKHGKVSDEVR